MPRRGTFTVSNLKLLKAQRIATRARKIGRGTLPPFTPVAPRPGMNMPETLVANALDELKIAYTPQATFGGGSILGGGRMDFLLPAYRIDIEYNGPFHGTTEGRAHDLLRNVLVQQQGYRVVPIYETDLRRIKPRILEIIGRPI